MVTYKQAVNDECTTSNQRILFYTMILFAAFVTAEIIGALASGSLSLLGDAAAMSIDVLTVSVYLCTYSIYK